VEIRTTLVVGGGGGMKGKKYTETWVERDFKGARTKGGGRNPNRKGGGGSTKEKGKGKRGEILMEPHKTTRKTPREKNTKQDQKSA